MERTRRRLRDHDDGRNCSVLTHGRRVMSQSHQECPKCEHLGIDLDNVERGFSTRRFRRAVELEWRRVVAARRGGQ